MQLIVAFDRFMFGRNFGRFRSACEFVDLQDHRWNVRDAGNIFALLVDHDIRGNTAETELLNDCRLLIRQYRIRQPMPFAEHFDVHVRVWNAFLDCERQYLHVLRLVLLPHFFF